MGAHTSNKDLQRQTSPYRRLSLRKNTAWGLFGTLSFAGSQWSLLVLLAHLGGPDIVGQFALGLAVCAPIFLLTNMNLRTVFVTASQHRWSFDEYRLLRCVTAGLALVSLSVMSPVVGWSQSTTLIILAVAIAKAAEAISDIHYGVLQKGNRMDLMALSLFVRGALGLCGMWLGLTLVGTPVGGVAGWAFASVVVLFCLDIPMFARKVSSRRRRTKAKTWRLLALAATALPIGLASTLHAVMLNVPRYFVAGFLGDQQLGHFAVVASAFAFVTLPVRAICQSALADLSRRFRAGNAAFLVLVLKLEALALMVCVGAIALSVAFGSHFLEGVFGAGYSQYHWLLVAVMVAAAFAGLTSPFAHALTAMRRFKTQLCVYVLAVSTGSICCWVLIPRLGLWGAVFALSAMSASRLLLLVPMVFVFSWRQRLLRSKGYLSGDTGPCTC